MTQLLDRAVERRYIVLACAAICLWAAELAQTGGSSGDWVLFVNASRSISDVTSVGVFFGPLMLLAAKPFTTLSLTAGWLLMSSICMCVAVVTIRWIEDVARLCGLASTQDRERTVLLGGMFVLYALSEPGASWGHPEDVFAIACIAFCLRAVAQGRWIVGALSIAAAADFKSWALLALPLAGACAAPRLRGVGLAVLVVTLSWLPFWLLHHGGVNTAPIHPQVEAWSGPSILGSAVSSSPAWPRYAQVIAALPLGALAIWRGRWELVMMVAFAIRINLDPATLVYYGAGALVGVFVWDTVRPLRVPGARTAVGCAALFMVPEDTHAFHVDGGGIDAVLRLLVLVVAIGAALQARPAERTSTA